MDTNFKSNSTEDIFLGIFWNLQAGFFLNIPWKMQEMIFFISMYIPDSNDNSLDDFVI